MTDAPMQAALVAIWKKNLPQVRERLAVLQRAANELTSTRTLDDDLRKEALALAHKLAGSLGMFGIHSGTAAARAIDQTLEQDGLPQPERLQEYVDALALALAPHLSN
ncbi:MAG: Hpt domain-containing protein [Terriglobus sp.]